MHLELCHKASESIWSRTLRPASSVLCDWSCCDSSDSVYVHEQPEIMTALDETFLILLHINLTGGLCNINPFHTHVPISVRVVTAVEIHIIRNRPEGTMSNNDILMARNSWTWLVCAVIPAADLLQGSELSKSRG